MNSADRQDSAIPMALYDCEDVASHLHSVLHSEFGTRKTDLFQRSYMRGMCRASLKMCRVPPFPYA